jgi:hypothetical protein
MFFENFTFPFVKLEQRKGKILEVPFACYFIIEVCVLEKLNWVIFRKWFIEKKNTFWHFFTIFKFSIMALSWFVVLAILNQVFFSQNRRLLLFYVDQGWPTFNTSGQQ